MANDRSFDIAHTAIVAMDYQGGLPGALKK